MPVDPTAWVAPSAVLSGEVTIGAHSRVLHGAVLTADGGPVTVGERCVVMEQAVLRGTRDHPLTIGTHVLVGPHAYLSGCAVEDEVFIATGAMIFNGASLGRASTVALGGAVHIGCALPAAGWVPIGWVAVGDPARIYPPGESQTIRDGLSEVGGFMQYVFGVDAGADRGAQMRAAMEKYTRGLAKLYR